MGGGVRVQGLEFAVWGLGFRVSGLRRGPGSGFRVQKTAVERTQHKYDSQRHILVLGLSSVKEEIRETHLSCFPLAGQGSKSCDDPEVPGSRLRSFGCVQPAAGFTVQG